MGIEGLILGNGSGLLGRSVSMLSFVANAYASGLDPFAFKLTNLAIHLLCGLLIYALVGKLLQRKSLGVLTPKGGALLVAAIWLLHPMQVSTVLYIVQRMAQLSTLFTLLALLLYVSGRQNLEESGVAKGRIYLFAAVPAAMLLAVLSKENGALAPLLCAVIELGYFGGSPNRPRPREVLLFFGAFLALPGMLLLAYVSIHPSFVIGGYQGRLFSLGERLLSEPRAIMDYIGALLLPRGPTLGVYTDDFEISHGLLTPITTMLSIVGIIALIVVALLFRKRAPAVFTGVALFFAAHVMESTVFPLELYFEHRNYLPSVGLFLALVGMASWLAGRTSLSKNDHGRLVRGFLAVGTTFALVLGVATFARAGVWSSLFGIASQGARIHPNSMRAQLDYANSLQLQGHVAEAAKVFDKLEKSSNPAARHVGIIDAVTLQCMASGEASPDSVARLNEFAGAKLQLAEMLAYENLGNFLQTHECTHLSKVELASFIVDVVDSAPQPARLTQIWRNRFTASRLYLAAGEVSKATNQAAIAWMSGAADPAVGLYLANLYFQLGDRQSSSIVLADATKRVKQWDYRNVALINALKTRMSGDGTSAAAPALGNP